MKVIKNAKQSKKICTQKILFLIFFSSKEFLIPFIFGISLFIPSVKPNRAWLEYVRTKFTIFQIPNWAGTNNKGIDIALIKENPWLNMDEPTYLEESEINLLIFNLLY